MTDTTVVPPMLSPEQIEANKATEAAVKAAEAAAKKTAKEAENKAKAEAKAAEKAAKLEARNAEKQAKIQAKADAKAAAEAAKASAQMPKQNDVRRPKPETTCGKCWATYDAISNRNGRPASISEALAELRPQGVNDATSRTQYAHWRKYNGVSGRVEAPKPAVAVSPTEPVKEGETVA